MANSERNLTSAASSALQRFYDRQHMAHRQAQKRMNYLKNTESERTGPTDITGNDYH